MILLGRFSFFQGKDRFSTSDRTIVLYISSTKRQNSCKGLHNLRFSSSYFLEKYVLYHGKGYFNRVGEDMYIDPNTGGILFQALAGIVAAVTGVLFFFSRQIRSGIARLRRRSRKEEDQS